MAANQDDLIISISTDTATIRRSLKRLEADISASTGAVQKQFESLGKGIDKSLTSAMQARIDGMVGVGTKATKEWTGALADQGKELDRLKAKWSPQYDATRKYAASVAEIKTAHALGALSMTEMTAAIAREKTAMMQSMDAIKKRNAALADTPSIQSGSGQFNTANIAAQFQDIAVTSAMGMSPLQIALQQGTQISAVLGPLGARGAVGALAGAFTALINPVSLVTIAVVAGSAALLQYFGSMASGSEKSEEALKKQRDLITEIANKYSEALPALKAFADEIARADDSSKIGEATSAAIEKAAGDRQKLVDDLRTSFDEVFKSVNNNSDASAESVRKMAEDFATLNKSLKDGTVNSEQVKAIQTDLLTLFNETGDPVITSFARSFDALAASIANVGKSSEDLKKQGAGLNTDQLFKQKIGDSTLPGLDPFAFIDPNRDQTNRANAEKSLKQKEDEAKAKKLLKENSKQNADDQFRNDLQAIQDRTAALSQEINLVGLSNEEVTKRRVALDLETKALAQLREEARKKGAIDLESINLSPDQVAAIDDVSTAYAAQAEKLRLVQDAQNQALQSASDFYGSLKSNTVDAISGAKSLGDAVSDLAKKLQDMALNRIFDMLFNPSGKSGSPDWLSGLFGAKTSSGTASIGPAVSSAMQKSLADFGLGVSSKAGITTYGKAIQSIESGGNYSALGPITKSGDRAYGAYQVMGNNIPSWTKMATGKSMTTNQFLASPSVQDSVFNQQFGKSISKFGNAQDAASVWFTGRPLAKGGNASDILGTTGNSYVAKFNASLDKMSTSALKATSGLGDLTGGLSSIGKNLASISFPSAPSGGGGFFSSLFGGFSKFKPIGAQATLAASGKITGLFADGTDYAPGGMAIVGEKGPELVNLPRGAQVIPNHKLNAPRAPQMLAMGQAKQTVPNNTELHVHVKGASGDAHVRELARQGAQEALHAHNESQRRGGFGVMSNQFTSRKA